MNNKERELWLDNDYELYCRWQRSGLSKREYAKRNKSVIDEYIRTKLNQKPRS